MSIPKGKKSLSARHIHMTAEKHKRTSVIKELEIERKYYEKPNMATDPQQAANFLQGFIQGMM